MGSYIESARENILNIVEQIVTSEKSDIHLALVEYRDHPPQVYRSHRGNHLASQTSSAGYDLRHACT